MRLTIVWDKNRLTNKSELTRIETDKFEIKDGFLICNKYDNTIFYANLDKIKYYQVEQK